MRGHTYHDHILDPLSERDREVVTNLVSEVQIKYTRYLALMVQRNPITWHDALEWIHNDLLGFLRDDKQLQELKVRIRGEANAPLYGSTLETLQRYARDATKWCKEVQCGLQKAEEHLAPHFDQAWATKALLYLRDVFGEQVPQSRPNYNLQVEKTYKMMVSLHLGHGSPRKRADKVRVLKRKYSPHVVVATVKKLIDNVRAVGCQNPQVSDHLHPETA